ncbi:MAG: hypothetical protein R3C56_03380 [Pirellulaceae bacterium]
MSKRLLLGALLIVTAACPPTFSQTPKQLEASAIVELGPDRGQDYGTLFEVIGVDGQTLMTAGFMAAYNTQPRSDRELLQVSMRPILGSLNWQLERLPDIASSATGFYPFSMHGELYIHNRSEKGMQPTDPRVYRWDNQQRQWIGEHSMQPYSERIAGKILSVSGTAVSYDQKVLLEPQPGARFGEHYFANGILFIKESNQQLDPPLNRLIACRWTPALDQPLSPEPSWQFDLPIPFEFMYAFGQLDGEVLAVSNNGRVIKFDSQGWTTLRTPPVPAVSYQVYSILTFYDRLLLGHYPTGELYEYANSELKLLSGWPPILPGVSTSAREAQTLAIYGGDLFAGIWPWAEVWRYDTQRNNWAFAQRMFEHPLPTDSSIHPYELETKQVDPVANLWGQRVTGLQPYGTGLVITTSSKSSGPWDPKFSFLTERQLADYGAIYLAVLPGNLAVPIDWQPEPTKISVQLAGTILRVSQDGRTLGQVEIPEHLLSEFQPSHIQWGQGVYGKWSGTLSDPLAIADSQTLPQAQSVALDSDQQP